MMRKLYLLFGLLGLSLALSAQNKPVKTITDASLVGATTYTWTKDTVYLLDGFVFLETGGILNIDPGTVIKGKNKPANGVDKTSALIITRGAQIFARGLEGSPIVFTAELDDVTNPGDLTSLDRGLWGGLVILGNGVIGEDGGEENIEGIPSTENKARYGGTAEADNSGVLRYVSIRHAGAELAPDNEINGLTMGGVGSGTIVDFIEVFANEDDGIEVFGGKVDIKHAVVSFCGDDSYDYDESWGGRGQFWFSIQNAQTGDNAGEFDGSEKTDLTPKNFPTIYNATFIGAGAASGRTGNDGFDIRSDAAVVFNNSIITDFGGKGLRIRNQTASDSYSRLTGGDTKFRNNLWFGFGAGATPELFIELYTNNAGGSLQTILDSIATKWNNQVADPLLGGISRTNNAGLDPRPNPTSPALSGALTPTDNWFETTAYRGAFSNSNNWAENWTALDQYGFFGDLTQRTQEVITDGDIIADSTYTWTREKEYILDGYVFVEAGAKLTIEPGTVIKGRNKPTNGVDKSSALIITRGAQIFANGTEARPIIFTAEADNVNDPADLTSLDRGLWGGLVILGRAIIGEDGGEENIEGIPSTENKARYGGANDADNSGTLRYVSIRHAGAEIAPDNEINGLTLGGVGSGTTIDFVEVFANEDDGIELFGGKVDIKHAVVSFCGDDSYDYDESWGGRGQFWFSIQNAQTGDNAGEFDGSEKTDLTPKNFPTIFNATFIGAGAASGRTGNDGFDIRADAAVAFNNSIVTDFGGKGLRIRNQTASDSYSRLTGGDTKFLNNIWNGFGAGNTPDKFVELYTNNAGGTLQTILDSLTTKWNNQVVDPLLGGISRTNNAGLDPRPNQGSAALAGALAPADSWFTATTYRGAFSNSTNWAENWTALAQYGFFGDLATRDQEVITDADLVAGGTYTWTKDKEYILDGYVFLEEGGKLTIEPGTVVKGRNKPTNGVDKSSALIITRGAQIFANGTKALPIIFTAEADDVKNATDLTSLDRGLWGGLVILGRAIIGEDGGEENIEGIPSTENKARYGGANDADNSGSLKYVSIRHAGAEIAPDNEINGLTLGGVGSGTTIDYIEVFANEDDGIELFGGKVDIKHAVVSFCGDDSYDYDESWGGRGQFWFSIQNAQTGDNAGEFDGSEKTDLTPKNFPTIFNATFIGAGASSGRTGNDGFDIRADAAVVFNNSIVADFGGKGLRIRNQTASDSYSRLTGGDTKFRNNLWFGFGAGNTPDKFVELYTNNAGGTLQTILDSLTTKWSNQVEDPKFGGVSRTNNAGLDPRPNQGSPALTGALAPADSWFTATTYRGAFSNSTNWAENWTALAQYGFFGDLATRDQEVITDADLVAGGTYTWTKDKEYILDGYVFLEEGGKLTIEPGTVVKGRNKPTNGVDKSSALIITRGAQIFANGTKALPIIFTAEADDVKNATDLTSLDRGLWGGLVILGRAIIGEDGGEENIEGIPSTENKARYGGTNDADNSGSLKYVSIRHAGAEIAPDNEINGLTLGGVGSGTTIDYIEVFANEDDGIELFGGKVDIKHAVVSFCGDDSYDYDESWGGRGQFWFSLQNAQTGDNAGEFDGSEKTDLTPKNFPTIFNATFIGAGASSGRSGNDGFDIRADAAVAFNNSIVTDFGGKGLRLRNQSASDSYARLTGGDTKFRNNLWFGFGAGNTPDKFVELYTNTAGGSLQTILDSLTTKWNNQVVDPMLGGISRTNNGGLDPRPNAGSPALSGALTPADSWFETTTYRGAFGLTNWADEWSALAQYGFFGKLATEVVELGENDRGLKLDVPTPNPASNFAQVNFNLPAASMVNFRTFDLSGRMIDQANLGLFQKGENQFNLNVTKYQTGLYILAIKTEFGVVTQKFAVANAKN